MRDRNGVAERLAEAMNYSNTWVDDLRTCRFDDIVIHDAPVYEHGIIWPQPWSLPISAREA